MVSAARFLSTSFVYWPFSFSRYATRISWNRFILTSPQFTPVPVCRQCKRDDPWNFTERSRPRSGKWNSIILYFVCNIELLFPHRAGQTYSSDNQTFLVQYWSVSWDFWLHISGRRCPWDIVSKTLTVLYRSNIYHPESWQLEPFSLILHIFRLWALYLES